jgi:lipoate-protein ligase A
MEIYEGYKKWEWRFGETPQFTNGIEKKFDWALMDIEFSVEKGKIKDGRCYSDCLVPTFIDELNEIIKSGEITYDAKGVEDLGRRLTDKFQDNEAITGKYVPELVNWMKSAL